MFLGGLLLMETFRISMKIFTQSIKKIGSEIFPAQAQVDINKKSLGNAAAKDARLLRNWDRIVTETGVKP